MGDTLTSSQQTSKLKIEYIKPSFLLHAFQLELENRVIFYQVIKMKDSLYIWIGNKNNPLLSNLSLAMQTRYDKIPLATKLLGEELDTTSRNIACRLSKRLNKVVYVSFNVEESNFNVPLIEKRLNEEINKYPDKF